MPSSIPLTKDEMKYSLLASSSSSDGGSGLPSPITSSGANKKQSASRSLTFQLIRLTYRRATVVVASLILLYVYTSGWTITVYDEVAITVPKPPATEFDTCNDTLPSGVRPGELIRFQAEDGSMLDNYYVPLRSTFKEASLAYLEREQPPIPRLGDDPDSSHRRCLDDHISKGAVCPVSRGATADAGRKLDVVWTYVNSTDPVHVDSHADTVDMLRKANMREYVPPSKKGSMREFDELRFSVRSVVANFRKTSKKLWVITSDFPFPGCANQAGWRVGQVPHWLSQSKDNFNQTWTDAGLELQLLHQSDIFEPLEDRSVFNSLAIESRLGFIDGVGDHFIYMNDDVFFNRELSPRDFYTHEYGPVFRMQPDVMIGGNGYLRGEWIALAATNNMLNMRFGNRTRPYLTHIAKTLSVPFLHEIRTIWPVQFARTATHPFRSYVRADPDVSTTLLQTHYVVERWREALLWSYVVGRIGGDHDAWGDAEMAKAWTELGGADGASDINVRRQVRTTLETMERFLESETVPKGYTNYQFSSLDGYPYTGLRKGWRAFPTFDQRAVESISPHPGIKCTINMDKCFRNLPGDVKQSASEIFKHVAFRAPECGDCIISALINKSGPEGLDAFLPDPSRVFTAQDMDGDSGFFKVWERADEESESRPAIDEAPALQAQQPTPRLPLAEKWTDTKFRMQDVLPLPSVTGVEEVDVRNWVVQALYRYRFVLGGTPVTFSQLEGKTTASRIFKKLDLQKGTAADPAIVCLNDDVGGQEKDVRTLFQGWMKRTWPKAPAWES